VNLIPIDKGHQDIIPAGVTGSLIDAPDDISAVRCWLDATARGSNNTLDSYRREAMRLLVWLEITGLTFRTMQLNHANDFLCLLQNPSPSWKRDRKHRKGEDVAARKFRVTDEMKPSSLMQARKILIQLFNWLVDVGYMERNVFRLSAKPKPDNNPPSDRLLDKSTWSWLSEWSKKKMVIEGVHAKAHEHRFRWLIHLLYHTGIRREEAAKGLMKDFVRRDGTWLLRVTGKGNKTREVTINSALLEELMVFRRSRGLPALPDPSDHTPLVPSINPLHDANSRRESETGKKLPADSRLTPRAIGLIMDQIAAFAAHDCEDPHIQRQIECMSPHFMRHTNASHRLMAGAHIESTQDELGHASITTTRAYIKVDRSLRVQDAEKLANFNKETTDDSD